MPPKSHMRLVNRQQQFWMLGIVRDMRCEVLADIGQAKKASGRYFETLIKQNFIHISGVNGPPCHSQKTVLSNELTFLHFDDSILEPIHFQIGTILKKKCLRKFLIYISIRYIIWVKPA